MKIQRGHLFIVIGLVALFLTATSCDQRAASSPIPDKKVVPEIKGIKLGATMAEVMKVAYGEDAYNTSRTIDLGTTYLVSVKEDSRISSIGGSNYDMSLSFQKGSNAESSLLYSITVISPISAFDSVLKGLTDKYGEGLVIGHSHVWSFFDRRYSINLSSTADKTFLSFTDTLLNGSIVDKNTKLEEERKIKDAKDI